MRKNMELRLLTREDFDFFYNMKCEENNMYWTGSIEKPKKENIYKFLEKNIKPKENIAEKNIYIITNLKEKIGYVYIEPMIKSIDKDTCEIPIAVFKKYQGKGYSKLALIEAIEKAKSIGYKSYVGYVREDNKASLAMCKAIGCDFNGEYQMREVPLYLEGKVIMSNVKMLFFTYDLQE